MKICQLVYKEDKWRRRNNERSFYFESKIILLREFGVEIEILLKFFIKNCWKFDGFQFLKFWIVQKLLKLTIWQVLRIFDSVFIKKLVKNKDSLGFYSFWLVRFFQKKKLVKNRKTWEFWQVFNDFNISQHGNLLELSNIEHFCLNFTVSNWRSIKKWHIDNF